MIRVCRCSDLCLYLQFNRPGTMSIQFPVCSPCFSSTQSEIMLKPLEEPQITTMFNRNKVIKDKRPLRTIQIAQCLAMPTVVPAVDRVPAPRKPGSPGPGLQDNVSTARGYSLFNFVKENSSVLALRVCSLGQ